MAGYFAPEGHYAASIDYFNTPPPTGGHIMNSPPLRALGANAPVEGLYSSANGVFSYGATSTFPIGSFNGTNYWVDPVFSPVGRRRAPSPTSAPHADISARPTSAGAHPPKGGPVTEYTDHALHRLGSPAGHDRHRHAAG